MSKILLIEDDPDVAREVATALRGDSYLVDVAASGRDASAYFAAASYDLVILDWGLPDTTGVDICREIRGSASSAVPVLFLTGHANIADKQAGFNSGADDYLTKPFHIVELMARVKALLRRPQVMRTRELEIRKVRLNSQTREVFKDSSKIDLLPKEFALLEFFMSHPNQIFSTDQVLRRVWPTDDDSSPETLRVTLMRLRRKLAFPEDSPLIVTLRGIGYRLDQ